MRLGNHREINEKRLIDIIQQGASDNHHDYRMPNSSQTNLTLPKQVKRTEPDRSYNSDNATLTDTSGFATEFAQVIQT